MQLLTEAHYVRMGLQLLITAKAAQEGGVQVALFHFSYGGEHVF